MVHGIENTGCCNPRTSNVGPTDAVDDEAQRVEAVARYEIFDTDPEVAFDCIWFKSHHGLEVTEDRDPEGCGPRAEFDGEPNRERVGFALRGRGDLMTPMHFRSQSHMMEAPASYDHAVHGECVGVPVRVEQSDLGATYFISCWRPDLQELTILNAGGAVVLGVQGMQPVISMGVETASELLVPA